MMKKLTSLLLSVVMLVSLLACGASAKTLSAKTLRIAGLKGPTTMGLVNLLSMEKNGTAAMDYDLQLYGAADEIVPKLIKGNLDMRPSRPTWRQPSTRRPMAASRCWPSTRWACCMWWKRVTPSTALQT